MDEKIKRKQEEKGKTKSLGAASVNAADGFRPVDGGVKEIENRRIRGYHGVNDPEVITPGCSASLTDKPDHSVLHGRKETQAKARSNLSILRAVVVVDGLPASGSSLHFV